MQNIEVTMNVVNAQQFLNQLRSCGDCGKKLKIRELFWHDHFRWMCEKCWIKYPSDSIISIPAKECASCGDEKIHGEIVAGRFVCDDCPK